MPVPIVERKHKPGGTVREFACDLLYRAPELAVIRYIVRQPSGFATPVPLPDGAVSDGYFWTSRPYSCYRMRAPGGAVVAHRFDAVADVRIEPGQIAYRDLVLDWWVLPDGTVLEEDRDELDDLAARGVISAADVARANAAARDVLGRYRHIIDEIETAERHLPPA